VKTAFLWGLRLFMSGLFLYSGVVKVADPFDFAQSVYNYRMLPLVLITPMALVLPWLEIWSALALLARGALRRAGWICITVLLLVFTFAKISALARGLDISCGCGTSEAPMTLWDLAENLFLLALCRVGLRFAAKP